MCISSKVSTLPLASPEHSLFGHMNISIYINVSKKIIVLFICYTTTEQCHMFVHHCSNYLEIDPEDGRNPDSLAADATFRLHTDQWFKGYESYESINSPEHFICHYNNLVRLARNSTSGAFETDASFRRQRGKREQKICDES